MKKLSPISSNKKIINNTSINNHRNAEEKITHILKTHLLKEKNLIIKSIQKRKRLPDKFIPKNEFFYSDIQDNNNSIANKTKIDVKKDDSNNEQIPFKLKVFDFQKKLNKDNFLINQLREENKMFHEGYQNSLVIKQKKNKFINKFETNTPKTLNDYYKNNIFNQSLLLTKQKRVPDYILESLDNEESKEDLKLIDNLKSNIKTNTIQFPDLLNREKIEYDEKRQLYKNIRKMKKEIKLLEKNISQLEKSKDSINETQLNNGKTKEVELFQKKLNILQTNNINKKVKFNPNDTKKAKSTNHINAKINLFPPEERGEYKLVTQCIVNGRRRSNQKKKLFGTYSTKLKMRDFYENYNKVKSSLTTIKRGKFSSDLINYSTMINNLDRKGKRAKLKKKFFEKDKNLDSLSSCLESFTENNNIKDRDVTNLYTYMKNGDIMNIKYLLMFYKKKYGKEYIPENVKIKKHYGKYNIVNKMKELDKLNNLNVGIGPKYRANLLENMQQLDELLKDGGLKFAKRILDFN